MTTYGAVISPVCIRIFPMNEPELLSAAKFVMDGPHMNHLLGRFALSERHKRKVLRALETEPRYILSDLELEQRLVSEFGDFARTNSYDPCTPPAVAQRSSEGAVSGGRSGGRHATLARAQAWSRFYERAVRTIMILSSAYNRHALAAGRAEWHQR